MGGLVDPRKSGLHLKALLPDCNGARGYWKANARGSGAPRAHSPSAGQGRGKARGLRKTVTLVKQARRFLPEH